MSLIRGLQNLNRELNESIVTIGNYDGLHLGHQSILHELKNKSLELNLPSVVIIFEPPPVEYFIKCEANCRLMTFREKVIGLRELGIDKIVCLHFNVKLANLHADEFVRQILVEKLNVKELYIGEDFVFGYRQQGNIDLLQKYAKQFNFTAHAVPTMRFHGVRVSSTLIRQALENGDLDYAKQLLGRPYSILGRVIHGDKLGRNLGFPTANVDLNHKIIPKPGVYTVKVYGIERKPLSGVANVGFRPTVGTNKRLLEVFLFDFSDNIYGKLLKIEFVSRVREEKKFANFELLRQQIIKDVENAKKLIMGLLQSRS